MESDVNGTFDSIKHGTFTPFEVEENIFIGAY